MKIIDKIIVKYLLSTDQDCRVFFASLLTLMKKTSTTDIPTMAVTIMDGQLHLLYNELFVTSIIDKYGVDKIKGILEHELLHVVYEHLNKLTKYNRIAKLYNISCDLAINQLIDKNLLPEFCPTFTKEGVSWNNKLLYPEQFNLPKNKDSEFYYNELLKKANKNKGKQGDSKGTDSKGTDKVSGDTTDDNRGKCRTIDDHSTWSKISESSQLSKEIVKNAVREAYKNTKKLRGTVSGNLAEMVQELLAPPTLNWKQLLRQYIGASIKAGFKSSWKRPNRRFSASDEFKGKTAKRAIRVLVGVDTSGSVSNKDFQDFLGELKGIMNIYKCNMDIVQCDTDIKKKETLRPYSKFNIKFVGRGGTYFTPVVDLYNKSSEYDLLIYFTDGYGDQEKCVSNKSVIWVLTTEHYDKFKSKCAGERIVTIKPIKEV